MSRFITLILLAVMVAAPATAGAGIRIFPANHSAELDYGDAKRKMTVKRIPEGKQFKLTVNDGKDVSFYQIQWFKDGQPIPGENGQHLTYPIATEELEGTYTVEMASPCRTVMSKPMQVFVERRDFQVNTEIPGTETEDGVAGGMVDETSVVQFTLKDCQPNPVIDRATIEFDSEVTAPVTLKIVDLNGNVVATLVNDVLPAGSHSVSIATRDYDMSSSMYYYVLTAPGFTDTKPMLLVK